MRRLGYCLISLLLLSNCTEDVQDVNLPEHKESLVIETLLNPEDSVGVYVDHSTTITDRLPRWGKLNDVAVKLQENGNNLGTLSAVNYGFYVFDQAPEAGKTYTITASHKEFDKVIGKARIPQNIAIESVKFEDSAYQAPGYDVLHRVTIEFKDPDDAYNYYSISGNMQDSLITSNPELIHYNPSVNFDHKGNLYMDDEGFGSGLNSFTIYIDGERYRPEEVKANFEITLNHITESYFLYLRQLNRQQRSGGSGPFSGEPAMSYSNVENGYGVVAGANKSTKKLQ